MARKRTNMITLHSWRECDDALRQIGEHTRDIRAVENVMNEQIAAAKAAADAKAAPLYEQIRELEWAIEDFALANRKDMDNGLKSKTLTFGTVGFRRSAKIVLPGAKEQQAAVIARLKALGMHDCIKQSEPRVDKEVLKKYSEEMIMSVGAKLLAEDIFRYEISDETICE